MKKTLILASGSERRRRILRECGVRFKVITSSAEEVEGGDDLSVRKIAVHNSRIKASDVASRGVKGVILGFDTVVSFKGKIFGKPRSERQAWEMLLAMNGRVCYVYTGVTVITTHDAKIYSDYAKTKVKMNRLPESDLRWLFPLLGPYDKAGGFTVEGIGSVLVERIEGCFFNVVGLPVALTYDLLKRASINLGEYLDR